MELRDYLRVLAKHWILITLVTLFTVAAAAVFTFTQPRMYSSTAQSFIAISTPNTNGVTVANAGYTQQRITSYLQIATSPDVLQPVIDELGLNSTPQDLAGSVTAVSPTGTVLIDISVVQTNPQLAADLANAISTQLAVVVQELETKSAGDVVPVKATLTQPAVAALGPVSPLPALNLMLGLVIGLALGVALAFVRESLDVTIKTPEDVVGITGQGSMGMISFDPEAATNPIVSLDQRATRAEAFRTIRTNLQYIDVDNPPKVVTITSSVPGEGKTTTAINLAVTMAQAGKKVVLVETDLRRPKTGRYLGIETSVGLTDVLAGQNTLVEALVPWSRGMLTVLPAGHTPPNPSELLASHHMHDILAVLRDQFDMVIVDATPLLPVTDGSIVAAAADGALLVIKYGSTTKDQVRAAADALAAVDARLLGTVVNFIPNGRRRYGYKYAYSKYGYKYGYGYGYVDYSSYESEKPAAKSKKSRRQKKDTAHVKA